MPFRITPEQIASLEYDLDTEIAKYQTAREAHKLTEGVPAPTSTQLVETIVRRFNGEYEIVSLVPYARIVDGKVMDLRRLPSKPVDPEWVRAQPGMKIGYIWDSSTEVWRKADEGKGATAIQLEQTENQVANIEDRLMKGETAIKFQRQMIEALQAENEEIRQRLNELSVLLGS